MTNGFLTFNSRANVITRYIFNQVRCFFTFSTDFMVYTTNMGYTSKIHEP